MTESDPSRPPVYSRRLFHANLPVFLSSAALIVLFVGLSFVFPARLKSAANWIHGFIGTQIPWLYVGAMNVFMVVALGLLCSPKLGKIRLGGPQARPRFSHWSWFAMLFSAGMGIGLLFYGVAEPIYHLDSVPTGAAAGSAQAARAAMELTFLHWGFHGWAIYALVGLALAFFSMNLKQPLTVSALFYPVLKERIHGPIGTLIDTVSVVATLFGVATSLGLGVSQINAGLSHLFGVSQSVATQLLLIGIITLMATTSVVLGVDKGIRRLSEVTMWLAACLLLYVAVAGPSQAILGGLIGDLGRYLAHLPALSISQDTYGNTDWHSAWTIFYWGWWIAWSPFVGMFIARISYGRTVRGFLAGVLLVPTLLTFLWLGIFGNAALYEQLAGAGDMVSVVSNNFPIASYHLLQRYPWGAISCALAMVVVVAFFVTSSDSGSLVVDIITAGGHIDPPVLQRIFWATMEGAVAAALLLGGGLKTLQTGAVATGLPLVVILLVMCVGLIKALRQAAAAGEAESG